MPCRVLSFQVLWFRVLEPEFRVLKNIIATDLLVRKTRAKKNSRARAWTLEPGYS